MSQLIQDLLTELEKLPSIGPKTSQRLTMHLMKQSPTTVKALALALVNARMHTKQCKICFDYSDTEICSICQSIQAGKRDGSILCVVKEHQDIVAIEGSKDYHGSYFTLGGLLDPMSGIGPEDINIKPLLERIRESWDTDAPIEEVIIALEDSVDACATILYITKLLKACSVKVTRIAFGISVGTSLEFADSLSIARAISGRIAL